MKKMSDEKGYPQFYLDLGNPQLKTWLVTLGCVVMCLLSLLVYTRFSTDLSPDSLAGYVYAIVGTAFMLLATFLYTRTRRSRQRKVGELNQGLNWHICFGIISICVLLLHSFGNFNPRTGTYALFGLLALVVSGFIGRLLDRWAPRQISKTVRSALTPQGEDKIDIISRTAQEIVTYNTQDLQTFNTNNATKTHPTSLSAAGPISLNGSTLPASWDIAYITLEETPQEVSRNSQQYRFVPDRKSALAAPGALLPGYSQQIDELQSVQQALQREQYFRALIRYWRIFHILLVFFTLAMTIWHLVYAGQLLLPLYFRH